MLGKVGNITELFEALPGYISGLANHLTIRPRADAFGDRNSNWACLHINKCPPGSQARSLDITSWLPACIIRCNTAEQVLGSLFWENYLKLV